MQPQQMGAMPQMAPAPVKKCNHMPIIIVLAILAVGGIGFGIFEMLSNPKDGATPETENKTPTVVSSEWTTVTDSATLTEAKKLLKKYGYDIDNLSEPMYIEDSIFQSLSDFSSEYKESYFTSVILKDENHAQSYTYDDLNTLYHSYFGDSENISKKDLVYLCEKYSYDTNTDKFDYYYDENCGVGGATPVKIAYQIGTVKTNGDKMAVNLGAVAFYDGSIEDFDEIKKLIDESLSAHTLNFEKYGDSYILSSIE